MDIKKENPPKKGGFPVATVIAVLTGLTSLLVFLTGKTNLPEILQGDDATYTPTSTVTVVPATPTPMPVLSPTPTAATVPSITYTPTESRLTARPPSDSELQTMPSLWDLTHFKELMEPGSNRYMVEIAPDSVWLWGCNFCTVDKEFRGFLDTLDLEFRIDETILDETSLRIFDQPGKTGWLCRNWSTVLSGWPSHRSVFLEIRYTHSATAFDGVAEFAAGEYSQTIIAVVSG